MNPMEREMGHFQEILEGMTGEPVGVNLNEYGREIHIHFQHSGFHYRVGWYDIRRSNVPLPQIAQKIVRELYHFQEKRHRDEREMMSSMYTTTAGAVIHAPTMADAIVYHHHQAEKKIATTPTPEKAPAADLQAEFQKRIDDWLKGAA